jgi:1-acyl-sn-glycerol-3-phosphate acyltransferase
MNNIVESTLYRLSVATLKVYSRIMLKMNISQKSPFPPGAKIIAPNHPSVSDPFIMASLMEKQSFILITNVVFQVPLFGDYLRRLRHIPVIPGRGQEAVDTALEHLKAGHTIIIFPEGDNSPLSGGFLKERTGVARLAIASGAPVFPVGIYLQKNLIHTIKPKGKTKIEIGPLYLNGPFNITIGKPMRFTGDVEDREHVKDVAHQVMLKIIRLADESKQRWIRNNKLLPGTFETI